MIHFSEIFKDLCTENQGKLPRKVEGNRKIEILVFYNSTGQHFQHFRHVISARHTSQSREELGEIIQLHLCARFLACELMYFLQKAKFNAFMSIKHRFNPRHDEKSYVFHLIFVSRSQCNFAVRFQFVLGKGNQRCACLFRGGGDPRLRLL